MGFIDTILWPIKWAVELLLVAFHWLFTAFGMDPAAGGTWVLSIIGLVVVARALLIPLFVKQIKNQRKMMQVAPQLKKIQAKYKGKRDQMSREAMSRETMDLYKREGANPMGSCLPLLVQMPIFFALFRVLRNAQSAHAGVGPLNETLAQEFGNATLFGAPLHYSFKMAMEAEPAEVGVMVIAAVMVVLMTSSQFFTQLQIMSKNISEETKNSPMFKQQRILLYLLPFVFLFSGFAFPLGVMFYWLTSNIWTMGQQFLIIRNMPMPGTEAAKVREERLARKGKLEQLDGKKGDVVVEERKTTQRQQPVGKARAKKMAQQQNQAGKPQPDSSGKSQTGNADTSSDTDSKGKK